MAGEPPLEPAGFGNCGHCPFLSSGPVPRCFACAMQSVMAPTQPTCDTCDATLDAEGRCRNTICNWGEKDRWFRSVWAIAINTGELRRAIHRHKYQDKWGWSRIFGRVLAGYLERNMTIFVNYDLIVPSPTFVGEGGRARDHTGDILRAAAIESMIVWPFDYDAVIKTAATPKMASTSSVHERLRVAEGPLRDALAVPDPARVADKYVLVVDDVFTSGHTLREVARALRLAGAIEVSGVVLARQPWT